MSKPERDVESLKQTRDAQQDIARPKGAARAWATVNKLPGGGKMDARRKVPSGPLGGSGRKTNQSRSS